MGRYALLLGTSTYHADKQLADLPSVRQDVHQLKAVLDEAGQFDDVIALLDLPQQALVQAVEDFYAARRGTDTALLYYSGHGIRHDDRQSVFLAATDTVTTNLAATALDTDGQLRLLLNHTSASSKVVLLDCCYSGAFSTRARISGGMRVEPRRGRRELGTFVLTSSTYREASKAQGPDQPSVFTETLLEGLRGAAEPGEGGWLTTSELSRYVMTEMARKRMPKPVESSEGVTEPAQLVLIGDDKNEVEAAVPRTGDDEAAFDADQWRRLLRYYVGCLRRSAVLQALINPARQETYAVFNGGAEQVYAAKATARVQLTDQVARVAHQARTDGKSLVYGYAVAVVKPQDRPVYAPLLVCDVEVSPTGELHAAFPPRPNLAVADLRKLSDLEVEQLTERVAQMFVPGDPASVLATTDLLMKTFGLGPLGTIDPTDLAGILRPAPIDRVQNVAVLYSADDAGGPQRELLQDLEVLIRNPTAIRGTALGSLAEKSTKTLDRPVRIVAPDRLNEAQEEIITAAMMRRLTVAQGPPGTGKSQLVTALLATATAAGEKVLIGSTGNQAVTSVSNKAFELVGSGLLMRTGNKRIRATEPEVLTELLSSGPQRLPDEQTPAAELRLVAEEVTEIRNTLDDVRLVERDLADLALERTAKPGSLELPANDEELHRLLALTERALHSKLIGWWYRWLLRRRHGVNRTAITELAWHAQIEAQWRARRSALPSDDGCWDRLTTLTGSERPAHSVELLRAQISRRTTTGSEVLQKRVDELSKDRPDRYACFPQLLETLPGWAVTAMSARQFKPDPAMFDLVVIDEAAQCTIPAILPMLFRAKRALIIGDPRQLQPVITLSEGEDNEQQGQAGLSRRWLKARHLTFTRHSTYDAFADAAGQAFLLDEHYRCHPDIVEPSNREVYQRRLTVLTDPSRLAAPAEHPLRWRHVSGAFEHGLAGSGVNLLEVAEVVQQVAELRHQFPDVRIGVVTPLARQQRELERALHRAGLLNGELFCATIHRFQGSERDIMVVSPVGAHGIRDRTRDWLIHQMNLWNVAITRAKSQLIVVGDQSWWSAQRGMLSTIAIEGGARTEVRDRETPAADLLHAALRRRGAHVQRNVTVQGQLFDLVVRGAELELPVLVDDPDGDADGRAFRKVLARLDIAGGHRVPAWRCTAEADLVADELLAAVG
ncbi:AAA domain-containing protein [Actinoplanes sp. TFC3]|uniref:caspase, EACC1-associated type n=1 Tax=Actinoplanes sp. TFC3 TaxID=1710355 RepID=UPI0008338C97|nr:AAA domain-containing protein [Actinoplanes sp. TFC3]